MAYYQNTSGTVSNQQGGGGFGGVSGGYVPRADYSHVQGRWFLLRKSDLFWIYRRLPAGGDSSGNWAHILSAGG